MSRSHATALIAGGCTLVLVPVAVAGAAVVAQVHRLPDLESPRVWQAGLLVLFVVAAAVGNGVPRAVRKLRTPPTHLAPTTVCGAGLDPGPGAGAARPAGARRHDTTPSNHGARRPPHTPGAAPTPAISQGTSPDRPDHLCTARPTGQPPR
ncbi:hypothetical protein ABTY61_37640 [Kitasatospora sp. NPDC096128]|uniref:hypothetical protein n=1 Tax=Kitasatospora sp. NPDC096128 TaxID=3155547 RepID=UPI003333CB06